MTTIDAAPTATSTSRTLASLGGAAVIAALINTGLGLLGALLAGPAPTGLAVPAPAVASVVGVLIGTAGWALVRRSTARPAAILRVLVPVAVVLTWIPDLLLLAGGATLTNVVTLMAMHVVVAAIVTPTLARVLPVA